MSPRVSLYVPRANRRGADKLRDNVRGGRNIGAGGAGTGEGDSGQTPAVTVFIRSKTGPAFGSARNAQHEQIPLQVSGVAGSGWLARGWCEEDVTKYGPSHRSQCGE